MATAVAAALSLTAGSAGAADCGCAHSASFPAPGACSCESSWGHGRAEPGPIYQTLDAFAGGIEKLLCLDDASRQADCEDACDAAMVDELSRPVWGPAHAHPPHPPHHSEHVMPPHGHHVEAPQSVSPYEQSPAHGGAPAADSMQMSRPRIEPMPESAIPERQLAPTRRRQSGTATDAAPVEDSQDPFLDDSVRVDPRGSRFVQPATYESGRAPRVSSRRIKSSR